MRKMIIKSLLAGMCVSFGAIAYVLTKNQGILGAALFSVGILLIIEFDFKLFTSYVPKYAPLGVEKDKLKTYLIYIRNCLFVFFFNFCGAALVSLIAFNTRIAHEIVGDSTFSELITEIVQHKLEDGFISVFLMSIFCGVIIACVCKATTWKHNVLYIIILITTFVVCGFDHVVANSFYLVFTGELFTLHGIEYFLITLIGNFIGGYLFMLVPLLGVDEPPHHLEDKLKKEQEAKKQKELEEKNLVN
ncbi:MAG: formate/nitrite transporter family protein [bacterium]